MKVYIVIYKHTLFSINKVDIVFADKKNAEDYIADKVSDNECVFCSWQLFEEDVK